MTTTGEANIEASIEDSRALRQKERKVILASSLGTVFEWYDFYLYGSLSAIIAAQFLNLRRFDVFL